MFTKPSVNPEDIKTGKVVSMNIGATTGATKTASTATTGNNGYVPKDGDEGFYATAYAEHMLGNQQVISGEAAVFKSISGWTDRKFYVLMNDVAPQSVVKLTNAYNKSIYAMVLGPLQETKGGTGLLLRISNSAANALAISQNRFNITVTYFQ
jgi:hypothetical protein